jgi:TM2 domain-containing membrane protein YozV
MAAAVWKLTQTGNMNPHRETEPPQPSPRRIALALLLLLFLGLVGGHAFYAGRWRQGLLYIVLTAAFFQPQRVTIIGQLIALVLLGMMALADLIHLLLRDYRDAQGRKLRHWL